MYRSFCLNSSENERVHQLVKLSFDNDIIIDNNHVNVIIGGKSIYDFDFEFLHQLGRVHIAEKEIDLTSLINPFHMNLLQHNLVRIDINFVNGHFTPIFQDTDIIHQLGRDPYDEMYYCKYTRPLGSVIKTTNVTSGMDFLYHHVPRVLCVKYKAEKTINQTRKINVNNTEYILEHRIDDIMFIPNEVLDKIASYSFRNEFEIHIPQEFDPILEIRSDDNCIYYVKHANTLRYYGGMGCKHLNL